MIIQTEHTDSRILAELGERLARYRLNRNLTQDQLAREAGVSKRTIVRLEDGLVDSGDESGARPACVGLGGPLECDDPHPADQPH